MNATKLILPLILTLCMSCSSNSPSSGLLPLDEINKSEVFDSSFKNLLKKRNYSMDIDTPNPLESVQPGNKYSNHHYNLAIDFPDGWQHDRGVAEYSIFRAFQADSGLSMALVVIPINQKFKNEKDHSPIKFEDSPLLFLNQGSSGDYEKYTKVQLATQLGQDPIDFKLSETSIGSLKYLVTEYRIRQVINDFEYFMRAKTLTIQRWDHTYEIAYFAPEKYYNPELLTRVAMNFRLMNPAALNR